MVLGEYLYLSLVKRLNGVYSPLIPQLRALSRLRTRVMEIGKITCSTNANS